MKAFTYTVRDELGLHARPAWQLRRLSRSFPDTRITVTRGARTVRADQAIRLMNLAVKQGETVTVVAEGPAEEEAIRALEAFFRENL